MTTRTALLGTTAAVSAAVVWTGIASASFLTGADLWGPFPLQSWQWIPVWWRYLPYAEANATVGFWLKISGGAATALVGAAAWRVWTSVLRRPAKLHGETHWATEGEARKSGLSYTRTPPADGIMLGRTGFGPLTRYVSLRGQQHVACYAPTEEGKSVSFCVPAILAWSSGSLVAFSVKRDLVDATAAERARMGNAVYVLDIGDPAGRTHRWNPLGLVRRGTPEAADDLQKAFFSLIAPEPRATNPYWADAGRRIATALAIILSETLGADLTVQAVGALARRPDCAATIRRMVQEARTKGWTYPKPAVDTLLGWADGLEKDSEEARGVRQTILTALALWEVPRIAAATAASDFDLRRLRQDKVSVFLVAQPSDILRMRPIFAIFFQQLIDVTAREEFGSNPNHRHRILCLLDELWALGSIRVLSDAVSFVRSSGLRMALVVQSKDQTRMAFTEEGSRNLYSNMGVEIALGGLDQKQAEEISQRGGSDTVQEVTRNRPRFLGWLFPAKQSESEAARRRPLMLAQEVQRLPANKLLVLRRRLSLLMLDRVVWFRDPWFSRLAGEPPPMLRLKVAVERDAQSPSPEAA